MTACVQPRLPGPLSACARTAQPRGRTENLADCGTTRPRRPPPRGVTRPNDRPMTAHPLPGGWPTLPDPCSVPTVQGSGKWQVAIMAALDGQPRAAREVVTEILGQPPSHSEAVASHRATRTLIVRGQLLGWLEPVPRRPPQLMVRRVDRWVSDSDSGVFAEQERAADRLAARPHRAP